MKKKALLLASLPLLALLPACPPEHVEDQPQPTASPSSAATARPTAIPAPEPSAEPMPEPKASVEAISEPKKPPPPTSGRPMSMYGPSKKIASTFGSTPGAILKLKTAQGDLTLKIGEGSLKGAHNITFEVPGKTRGKPPVLGDTVHLAIQEGDDTKMSEIDSSGPPFTVIVPSKKKVNLAVCMLVLNEAGQETDKVKDCVVYPPLRVDDGLGQVVFELTHLGPSVMYATLGDATVKPAE